MASTAQQRQNYLDRIENNAAEFVRLCNTKVSDCELPKKMTLASTSGRNLIHNIRQLVDHVDMLDDLLKKNSAEEVTS